MVPRSHRGGHIWPAVNIQLYSALYGPYERAKKVPSNLGVPAIMYTDNPDLDAPGWEVRVRTDHHGYVFPNGIDRAATQAMMDHKYWKLHPDRACPDADITMWMDASMEIVVEDYVERCLAALGDDDWVTVTHPARDCIYTEASYSATLIYRYDPEALLRQADFYRSIGHPPGWGLFATGANVRRHTEAVIDLGVHWWFENVTRSHQDQVSFPVLLRMMEDRIKWNRNMPWFQWWRLHEHGM